jgi:hypothetical protein
MMKMRNSFLAAALIISMSFISCGGGKTTRKSTAKGPTNRGTAQGYATIFDNDKSLARDRASDDAKSKLVRKVLGETIEGRSIMKDYELVANIVEAKSVGLVKDVNILESKQQGNEMFVTIEGTVEPAAVNDAIQAALENYGRPKFMVLINETFDGKRNLPGFTETETIMQEVMGDSGFEFVDAAMTQQMMKRERRRMQNAMAGKVNEDVQQLLLNSAGAEVLILGTATTRDQSGAIRAYAKNMKSKSAIIRVKALDVYTGRILATISRNAPGVHIESSTASKKAIENALKQILGKKNRDTDKFETGKFINSIVKKFVKAASAREINVLITGLDYKGLTKFRNNVSQRIRGVSKVISKGQIGRAARVMVYFAGKTNDFTDELLAKAGNMGFEINIKETFPNKIVMTAKQQ